MSAIQPAVSLQQTPTPEAKPTSPTGFFLQSWQKGGLLVLLLGILYLRILRQKKARILVCSHCGKKNPPHLAHCQNCAAPLLDLKG